MEHLHTKIVTETASGKIAVMARIGLGHRWMQVDSCSSRFEADDYASELEEDYYRRKFVIGSWVTEDWGRDAPIHRVVTEPDLAPAIGSRLQVG